MYYHEFDPPAALAAHVSCFWGMEIHEAPSGYQHQVLPDGCVNLIASRRARGDIQLSLQGPRLEPLWIPIFAGDRFWGARLWPDAGAEVVGRPAAQLRGTLQPASDVLGAPALTARDRLAVCTNWEEAAPVWEALLGPLVARCGAPDAAVRAAVLAIVASRGEAPVVELARSVGLGPRQFQRRFGAAVGLTPKQFARVRRLRSALVPLLEEGRVSWSAVAAELGFADQPHLIREFVALAGLTPREVAERIARIGHGRVRP